MQCTTPTRCTVLTVIPHSFVQCCVHKVHLEHPVDPGYFTYCLKSFSTKQRCNYRKSLDESQEIMVQTFHIVPLYEQQQQQQRPAGWP